MDVRQLRYLIGVIETESFTRASEALRIAQPALGLQIRKLEEELGTQLLLRHSRGVKPTDAGLMLYNDAKELLARLEQTISRVRDASGVIQGRVSVGMTPSVNATMATKLVRRCAAELPLVSLSIVEQLSQNLLGMLEADQLNITFAHHDRTAPGLEFEPLAFEKLFFIQPVTEEPDEFPIPLGDVVQHRLILPSAPHALRVLVETKAQRRGLKLDVPYEVHSWATICELVEQGHGASILPYSLVQSYAADRRLIARDIIAPRFVRTLYLVTSRNRPISSAERAVCDAIRETVAAEIAQFPHIWTSARLDPA